MNITNKLLHQHPDWSKTWKLLIYFYWIWKSQKNLISIHNGSLFTTFLTFFQQLKATFKYNLNNLKTWIVTYATGSKFL